MWGHSLSTCSLWRMPVHGGPSRGRGPNGSVALAQAVGVLVDMAGAELVLDVGVSETEGLHLDWVTKPRMPQHTT